MKKLSILFLTLSLVGCSTDEPSNAQENMYFPPIGSTTWETKSVASLGWNETAVEPLLAYLEEKHTKGFIILQNGKIVMENYFNGHSATESWYWASAGKTLTATVVGIAEQEGYLNTNNRVSDYLGTGWTSIPLAKENLIINKHLLTMTSGLNDQLGDAVSPDNLQYIADAGTRWAYHNVYVKLQDIVAQASNQTWNSYFNSKLRDKIGMTGLWFSFNNSSVYRSNTRSMARFGLLALNKGKWENTQVVPQNYMQNATTTSQSINLAYGYLWWLNGKTSFHLPQSQYQFPGNLIVTAPADMYCALGKDDQKIYVVPSKKLVIIRIGEAADDSNAALSDFDEVLWEKINAVIN